MLDGLILIIAAPNVDTFRTEKIQADPLKPVLGIGLLGVLTTL
jgi:hypothetical protein